MKNKKIIICKVVEIEKTHIITKYKSCNYKCPASQVSDYPVDLFAYFEIGKNYKFLLVDDKYISYKAIRPKLLKNKNKPMSTISGVKNLEKYLLKIIGKEV
ncbi:MAG: hypothetical protein HDR31_00460 [Mycoplasma sp.]|nr:hypothetical protein [Mycoplasma sp.]